MKLYMFRTVPLPIIRSFPLYTQQWYTSYRFVDSLRAGAFYVNTVSNPRKYTERESESSI